MPRPRKVDPKKPITVSLRTSTVDALQGLVNEKDPGGSVGLYIARAVEAKYGRDMPDTAPPEEPDMEPPDAND